MMSKQTESKNYEPSPRIKNALLKSSRTFGCRLSEFTKIKSGQYGQTYWANFAWRLDNNLLLYLKYEADKARITQTFNNNPENIPLRWEKELPPALKFLNGICQLTTEKEVQQLIQRLKLEVPSIKKPPLSWKQVIYDFINSPPKRRKVVLAMAVVLVLAVSLGFIEHWQRETQLELAEAYNNQVVQYSQEGQYQKAQPLAEEALKIRTDVLGEKHQYTLTSLNHLMRVYQELGRLDKALPLSEKSYRLSQEVLGEKHPDTLVSLNNLASIYSELGRFSEALPLVENAYSLGKEVLGEKHPNTLTSLNQLAMVYQKLGRLDDALPLYEKSYRLSQEVLGEKHPYTLTSLTNLAGIYNNRLDISYDKIIQSPNFLTIQKVQHQIKLPWKGTAQRESASFFSSSSPRLSLAMQAFSAGLWKGQQYLLSQLPTTIPDDSWLKKDWSKTEWADYFKLGRWTLLLETVSQSVFQFQYEVPEGFWEQQQLIFADLKTDFLERRDKHDETEEIEVDWVMSRFEEYIEPLLKQLPDDSQPHLYEKLAKELKEMREGLAPL
jgi:tetratricopeptide (TPR) repeat protein